MLPQVLRRTVLAMVLWTVMSGHSVRAASPSGNERLPGHRNLFNGDCTFLFGDNFVPDTDGPYDVKTLHWFIDVVADHGVDTYLVNPIAQLPWYPSQRTPHILTGYNRGDVEFFRGHFRQGLPKDRLEAAMADQARFLNRYLDLAEAGINWIDELSQACRRRKISPWLSVRMNDLHGANSWEKSYMNCALQKDPKYRLSGRQINPHDPKNRMEQGLNYACPEVRDYMLLMIRELVEEHDFEGLELDWLRSPYCLEAPASAEGIAMMAAWIGEVRRLTQAKAEQTGKPYPLGLRVPCRLGLVKAIGLDVAALARSGEIDFICCSNSWQTTWDVPYDEMRRELGERVALYGVIEDAPNWISATNHDDKKQWLPARLLSASPELLRGNASGKLAVGADGIETFNFFCTDELDNSFDPNARRARYPAMRDLEKLGRLRGEPKQYALSSMQGQWIFAVFEYAEQVPAVLEPEWKKAFRLSMCAEPADAGLELTVQLIVEKPPESADAAADEAPALGISFNGSWPQFDGRETDELLFPAGVYTHHVSGNRAFDFSVPVSAIKEGWNEVLVFNGQHRGTPDENRLRTIKIVGVELAVKKRSAGAPE